MIQASNEQSNTRERLLYHLRKRLMNKNEWNGRMVIVPLTSTPLDLETLA